MKKKLNHLVFCIQTWVELNQGKAEHPVKQMKNLGITYQHGTPQSIGNRWIFWNCSNIPDPLPTYLSVEALHPISHIGFGLSEDLAKSIERYYNNNGKINIPEYMLWTPQQQKEEPNLFDDITNEQVKDIMPNLRKSCDKYYFLMELFNHTNVSLDKDFQRLYNGFYRMGWRNQEYYNYYFYLLEESKKDQPSFLTILNSIYSKTGQLEPSFSSKLLHTCKPHMPIWDKYILQNLNIKDHSKRNLSNCDQTYEKIEQKYITMLMLQQIKEWLQIFDNYYKGNKLTDVKKIDFILWQIRG